MLSILFEQSLTVKRNYDIVHTQIVSSDLTHSIYLSTDKAVMSLCGSGVTENLTRSGNSHAKSNISPRTKKIKRVDFGNSTTILDSKQFGLNPSLD